jgi:phosphoglycerate kinase
MARFFTIDDLPALQGDTAAKRILVRGDLNVPVEHGRVSDAARIRRFAPTVLALIERGCRVAVLAHFGRPKGRRVLAMSLRPLVRPLGQALGGRAVVFSDDCIGAAAENVVNGLPEGGVALLENLRYHPGEEANDPQFAAALAKLGDVYVNDAFSVSHRAHASTEALAHLLPAAAGRLMQAELEALDRVLTKPERPLAAIVGGAKVSTKLDLLNNLVKKVNVLVLGGAMANTFLSARGIEVGKSLCEHEMIERARSVMDAADRAGCQVVLPRDVVVAPELETHAPTKTVPVTDVPSDEMILDMGPDSTSRLVTQLGDFRTLVWNGPLGAFEVSPFNAATVAVAKAVAALTRNGRLVSVAGGGETAAALAAARAVEDFSYVSTAGGAFLEWLEGKKLPGVEALFASA